jgi:hypothetical protein
VIDATPRILEITTRLGRTPVWDSGTETAGIVGG